MLFSTVFLLVADDAYELLQDIASEESQLVINVLRTYQIIIKDDNFKDAKRNLKTATHHSAQILFLLLSVTW